MSNPIKGDVTVEAEGKAYTLRYSANALCELEDVLGRGFIDIAAEMQGWTAKPREVRLSMIRAVFWAGLRDAHPDITLAQAGELILAAGGAVSVMEHIDQAFTRAFPAAEMKGARPPNRAERRRAGKTS